MDRDIRAAVHEELVTDPLIKADDIVVEVFNGVVVFNGTVPSQDQSSEAAAAARRVADVTVVQISWVSHCHPATMGMMLTWPSW